MFRLYKDSTNKMFGGVCAGIADATNTDVTLIRVATVIANLMFRVLIPVYFILLVILPEKDDADSSEIQTGLNEFINSLRTHSAKHNIKSWIICAVVALLAVMFAKHFLHINIKWKYLIIIGLLIAGLYLMTTRDLHNNPSKIIIGGASLCMLGIFWLASSSGFLYFPVAVVVSALVNLWPVCLAAIGISLLVQNKRHIAILWGAVAIIAFAITIINYFTIIFG